MKAIIVNQSKSLAPAKEIQQLLNQISAHFSNKRIRNRKKLKLKKELTIAFLSKSEMKFINFQFRKKNKPTDVLSFESTDPSSLGELLLCCEVLKKQAKDNGHSPKNEMTYMLIHGILHLLGYDHELSKKEEKLMFSIQDQCFENIKK